MRTVLKMVKDLVVGDLIVEGPDTYRVLRVVPRGSTFVNVTVLKDGEPTTIHGYAIGSVKVAA